MQKQLVCLGEMMAMKNSIALFVLICANIFVSDGSSNGIFTIVSPKTIHPSSNFTIHVSGNPLEPQSPPPLFVYLDCQKISTEGQVNFNDQIPIGSFKLESHEHATGSITTANHLTQEQYRKCEMIVLHNETNAELRRTTLNLISLNNTNPRKIFIQMDKPAYKPGDLIRLRIVVLDKNNLPDMTAATSMKVLLKDSKGILMNQWPNKNNAVDQLSADSNGLIKLRFPLATDLNLGVWTIIASSKNGKTEKKFLVEKYVLPKFFVKFTLLPKPYINTKTTKFTVVVDAAYTYGKSLVGTISLSFFDSKKPKQRIVKNGDLIHGRAYFHLDVGKSMNLTKGMELKLEANVTEIKTKRSQVGVYNLKVHGEDPYKITWLNPQQIFKRNVPFSVRVAVSTFENLPANDSDVNALTLTSKFGLSSKQVLKSAIPANGIVSFLVNPPKNPRSTFDSMSIQYKSKILHFAPPRPFHSGLAEDYGLDVEVAKADDDEIQDFERGEEIKLLLKASSNILTKVNYVLWSGNEVIDFRVGQTVANTPSKLGSLNVLLPRDRIYTELVAVIYFIHGTEGAVISASVVIPCSNYLTMIPNKNKFEPRQRMALTFYTHPGSTIAIRGIDLSNLLLSQDKDYNDVDPWSVPYNPFHVRSSQMTPTASTSDFHNEFLSNGLEILTNGFLGHQKTIVRSRRAERSALVSYGYDGTAKTIKPTDVQFWNQDIITRTHFPESWIWKEISNVNLTTIFSKDAPVVPDTMTSWYLTAMSINKNSGFAVTPLPRILTVFRPFFITLDLPYSIQKGDTFELRVIVHNYLEKDVLTEIMFYNDAQNFKFMDSREQVQENVTRTVKVKSQEVDVVVFVISPLVMGQLPIHVRAVTDVAGDAVLKTLLVEPSGFRQWSQIPPMIYYGNFPNDTHTFEVKTITKRGADQKITITGNLVPSTTILKNRHGVSSLIKLPQGCAEQRMMGFVENILAMEYLRALKKLDSKTEEKILDHLKEGHQQIIKYFDIETGSFKFHKGDDSSTVRSTWLTAFILRCLSDASKYTTVDYQVIIKGLNFLLSKQSKDHTGEFLEQGQQLHNSNGFKGGLASENATKYGITAYVTLTLLEVTDRMKNLITKNAITSLDAAKLNGLRFISSASSLMDSDPYSLLIVTTTLHAASHPSQDRFFEKIEKLARNNSNGEYKWWQFDSGPDETEISALSVEMTAYGLLTYLWRPQVPLSASEPIVKWLLKQRTENGGFKSSQDTVVALTALSKFASRASQVDEEREIDVFIKTDANDTYELKVNQDNSADVHDVRLPRSVDSFNITTKGKGRVYLHYSEGYYSTQPLQESEEGHFKIAGNLIPILHTNDYRYIFKLCTQYDSEEVSAGQVVATVKLPSDYSFEKDEVKKLMDNRRSGYKNVKNIEIKEGSSVVHIYYDHLDKLPTCLELEVYKSHNIASDKNGHIYVTDYYNPKLRTSTPVLVGKKSTVCDLCISSKACDLVSGCDTSRDSVKAVSLWNRFQSTVKDLTEYYL